MFRDLAASACFTVASVLTDPVCMAHRTFRETVSLHRGYMQLRSGAICLVSLPIALLTSIPGVFLRILGVCLKPEGFLYERSHRQSYACLESNSFALLSWNVVGMNSGHVYTHAGVTPFFARVEAIAQKIIAAHADVVCLYEMMDFSSSVALKKRLKSAGYVDFYYNIGASAAVSSGIFVASKVKTQRPRFIPYKSSLGTTFFQKKGVFSVNIVDAKTGRIVSRLSATHAQHSQEPEFPKPAERRVRQEQLLTACHEAQKEGGCAVLTGDLNCSTQEYRDSAWARQFDEGSFSHRATWDGDAFSAKLVGQRPSLPQRLDHTLVINGSVRTKLIETGFDPRYLLSCALSDHKGLYSRITVGTWQRLWNDLREVMNKQPGNRDSPGVF